jgi:hypothetical protein
VANSIMGASDAAERWVREGLVATMNHVNQPKPAAVAVEENNG